jgi:hypothetical protein
MPTKQAPRVPSLQSEEVATTTFIKEKKDATRNGSVESSIREYHV